MAKRFLRPVNTTSYYSANCQYAQVNKDGSKMRGFRRVITFCLLTTVLPTVLILLPLYLRNIKYADVMYKISDSDVIQIHKGQSSIFCEKHSLEMNTSFSAFQMKGTPELSGKRKHINLKKSMTLSDETFEYFGFYLLKGASVELNVCSQHKGSKILVVRGERTLNICGILEGYRHKKQMPNIENQGLLVTLEKPVDKTNNVTENRGVDIRSDSIENNNTENQNNPSVSDDDIRNSHINKLVKRDIKNVPLHNPNTILDTGVYHGGNAINSTVKPHQPVSSFENSLYECYRDKLLMNNLFPYSDKCNSTNYLEKTTTLKVVHEVLDDAYYYYIFYNDKGVNGIHAIFDIYKPTFQYVNNSEAKMCINKTTCEFYVDFLSDELVIVEKPTKQGLQNEESDSSILISVCHPRVSIYIFFPISVLLLVLLFAFL